MDNENTDSPVISKEMAEQIFSNVLILDTILSYMPFPILLEKRQVNSVWKNSATRCVAPRCRPVDVHEILDAINPLDEEQQQKVLVKDIQPLLNSNFELPPTSFELDVMRIENLVQNMNSPTKQEIVRQMFAAITRLAKELVIDLCNGTNIDKTFANVVNVVKNAEKLYALHIRFCEALWGVSMDVLSLLDNESVHKITHLHLSGEIKVEMLVKLRDLQLKLKYLCLDFKSHRHLCTETLHSVFQTQNRTLEELKILGAQYYVIKVTFPVMWSVHTLTLGPLGNSSSTESAIQFPDLQFAQQFPVLRKLSLVDKVCERLCKTNRVPATTVERLDIGKQLTIPEQLPQIFPNVRHLSVEGIVLKELSHIVTNWKQVDTLVVHRAELALEEFVCPKQTKLKTDLPEILQLFLQNIKVLRLRGIELLDSHLNVLLPYLVSLKYLDLWNIKNCSITNALVQRMKDKFAVCVSDKNLIS